MANKQRLAEEETAEVRAALERVGIKQVIAKYDNEVCHHTEKDFAQEDADFAQLAWYLGTLDLSGDESSVEQWMRVARALRLHGLKIVQVDEFCPRCTFHNRRLSAEQVSKVPCIDLVQKVEFAGVFSEWFRRFYADPEQFASDFSSFGETDYGKNAAAYFMKLRDELRETAIASVCTCEQDGPCKRHPWEVE